MCWFFALLGGFRWSGGLRTPRYHGPLGCLPQKGRVAHGRSAVNRSPETLCGFCLAWFSVIGFGVGFLFGLFVCLGGRISVKDFLSFKTRPVFAMISVVLFIFLVVWYMCRHCRSLSLSRSLSGRRGNTNLIVVCVSSCVFFSRPRSPTSARTSCSASTSQNSLPRLLFLSVYVVSLVVMVGLYLLFFFFVFFFLFSLSLSLSRSLSLSLSLSLCLSRWPPVQSMRAIA